MNIDIARIQRDLIGAGDGEVAGRGQDSTCGDGKSCVRDGKEVNIAERKTSGDRVRVRSAVGEAPGRRTGIDAPRGR